MHSLDQLKLSNTYSNLPEVFYSRVTPAAFAQPKLASINHQAAALLDLNLNMHTDQEIAEYFCGAKYFQNSSPVASVYAGHQFGVYVHQLGDGRALILGDIKNQQGEIWEIQLKGSGITPYSRHADGRAVLRSSIREYLCSEAMFGLGIPTTRALALVVGDEKVYREEMETAAMVTRLAPTHIRFGTFEYFHHRMEIEQVKSLADHLLTNHFQALLDTEKPYAQLFQAIVSSTATLIAQWQTVGFAHGVMNTDNMSVLGLTLDYGPFAFLDSYQSGFICNHSDYNGRYAFNKQPAIGLWNLNALAHGFSSLVEKDNLISALKSYEDTFLNTFETRMAEKLGFSVQNNGDSALLLELLTLMEQNQVDYTLFFRQLSYFKRNDNNTELRDLFINRDAFDHWADKYQQRLDIEHSKEPQRQEKMLYSNPKFVLRNYIAEEIISAARKNQNFKPLNDFLAVLHSPFEEHPDFEHYAAIPPEWSKEIAISCSS